MKPLEFKDWPEYMLADDIKKCMRWGNDKVSRIMNQPDFPLVDRGSKRNRQVHKEAFREWSKRNQGGLT